MRHLNYSSKRIINQYTHCEQEKNTRNMNSFLHNVQLDYACIEECDYFVVLVPTLSKELVI